MPEALEQQVVLYLTQLFDSIGWAGVVAIMALESANFPIPSEVPLPLAGWLLVQARGGSAWQAAVLGGFFGSLGCTIGSLVSYAIGAWGGRPLLDRYGKYLRIGAHDLEVADRWFARWGDATIFLSRMVPLMRTFISLPAGVARARLLPFTAYTFAGSFLWCAALSYGGYVFGSHWEELRAIMRPFDLPIAALLIGAVAYYFLRRLRRNRSTEPSSTPTEG